MINFTDFYNVKFNIYLQSHLDKVEENSYKEALNFFLPEINWLYIFFNTNIVNDNTYNINKFNRFFNEYCVMYFLWKSGQYKNLDLIGFGHYRRYINPLTSDNKNYINDIINKNYIHVAEIKPIKASWNLHTNYRIKYKNHRYQSLLNQLKSFSTPDFIIDDFIEYLDSYKHIFPEITNIFKREDYLFIRRSMFICNKDNFNNIMLFVSGFFDKLFNKYNLSFSDYNGFINWYYNNIISEYKLINYKKILYDNIDLADWILVIPLGYQSSENFIKIFDKSSFYGLNDNCNCWRIFGYMTEILINIYIILSDNAMFTTPIRSYRYKKDLKIEFNNSIDYKKIDFYKKYKYLKVKDEN